MRRKFGRNEPCPCGSGRKYKKCHGSSVAEEVIPQHVFNQLNDKIIKQKIREANVGDVRPNINFDFKGYKLVAVGNQLHYAKNTKWKTFHNFLFDYIKQCLGSNWGNNESAKEYSERHPVLQWYKDLCEFQRSHMDGKQGIYSADCSGPERLINRLKDKKQFQGARYEVYVTASFIKAGFNIEFEDESDRSTSHCEFVATHKASGTKYSVEAKSRHREGMLGQEGEQKPQEKQKLRIGTLLRNALQKKALYPRIVFVDVNMPPEKGDVTKKRWIPGLIKELSRVESDTIEGNPCPPAYLYFTNHPNHYVGNDVVEPQRDFLITAINVPEFKVDDAEDARKKHPHILSLWDSINLHNKVPNDFEE